MTTSATKPLYIRHLGASGVSYGTAWRVAVASTGRDTPMVRNLPGSEPARHVMLQGPIAEAVKVGDLIEVEWPR